MRYTDISRDKEEQMVDEVYANQPLYNALRIYFLTADERAVFHALPSHVAAQIGHSHRATLETLVEAMFNGDTTLNWELECPHCHGIAAIGNIFYLTPHDFECPACKGQFIVHTDHEAQSASLVLAAPDTAHAFPGNR